MFYWNLKKKQPNFVFAGNHTIKNAFSSVFSKISENTCCLAKF